MKKALSYILPLIVASCLIAGCGRPRVIPNDELSEIFKDVYLVNAYLGTIAYMRTDTLDIYRPILERYGYSVRDLEHTFADFARRKSAKVGLVLEKTAGMLESEQKLLAGRIAMQDTVDARSIRMFEKRVLEIPLIEVRSVGDTSKLRHHIPFERGTYELTYHYHRDSADKNNPVRALTLFRDTAGKVLDQRPYYMVVRTRSRRTEKIEARDDIAGKVADITLLLASYPEKMTRPHLTIDSLTVIHRLPADVARDSALRTLVKSLRLPYVREQNSEADSGALRPDATWFLPMDDRLP